jgi:hypothetical protein
MLVFSLKGEVGFIPNFQAGGLPIVGCPRLIILYIYSCPPYVEDVIRDLRTRLSVVTRDLLEKT